jgi:hypothetical protein
MERVGDGNLTPIVAELERVNKENPLTGGYFRALVLHCMTHQFVGSAKRILDSELSADDHARAWSFLRGALRAGTKIMAQCGERHFEVSAKSLFQCSIGSSVLLLETGLDITERDSKQFAELRKNADACNAIQWGAHAERWARGTNLSVAEWAWWAETATMEALETTPGPVWQKTVSHIRLESAAEWSLSAGYPKYLLKNAGVNPASCLEITSAAMPYLSERGCEGWLYDVLSGAPQDLLKKVQNNSKSIKARRVASVLAGKSAKELTMDEWAAWTKKRYREDPFDPRISEWTALGIVWKIANELTTVQRFLDGPSVPRFHCANFTFPAAWTALPKEDLTWERWRSKLQGDNWRFAKRALKQNALEDWRLVPFWPQANSSNSVAATRGLGIILLGLLSRSFDWPREWNVVGHREAFLRLAQQRLESAPCSSWTMSILEGCLSARPRETFLLKGSLQIKPKDDDSTIEPVFIGSVERLGVFMAHAMGILQANQITVQNHLPRQLTPVNIAQLASPTWLRDIEEGRANG